MAKTCFFWDDLEGNIIEEYDEAGNSVADYTTEPDHFGNVISQHRSGESRFFHYDTLGSTLAVTDDGQQVADIRGYSAFGETTESSGGTVFPFQYMGQQGYYRDDVLGVYFLRRRDYDPAYARCSSVVTLVPHIVNVYVIALNNPLGAEPPKNGNAADKSMPASLETEMKCPGAAEKCKDQACWWRQTISASGTPTQVCVRWQKGVLTVGMTAICCEVDRMWGSGYISVTFKGEKPCIVKNPTPEELEKCGIVLVFSEGDPPDANPTRAIGFCVKGSAEKTLHTLKFASSLKLTCKCDGTTTRRNWKTQLQWSIDDGTSGKELPNPDAPIFPPE